MIWSRAATAVWRAPGRKRRRGLVGGLESRQLLVLALVGGVLAMVSCQAQDEQQDGALASNDQLRFCHFAMPAETTALTT